MRVLGQQESDRFGNMMSTLLAEAFVDGDAAQQFVTPTVRNVFDPDPPATQSAEPLRTLLADPSLLHEFVAPKYWLERHGGAPGATRKPLATAFVELVDDMREYDYFPDVLPKRCVDDGLSWDEFVQNASGRISRAVQADVAWPLESSVADEVLYSVIEFLHDEARRPRMRSYHSYSDCGWHYESYNKETGGVVYRWRVNELLDRYGADLRLGARGAEKGRLIRHAGMHLDELADELSDSVEDRSAEKTASAIRLFRNRASTVHDRRAAVAQLAGALEKQRKEFKAGEFARGDEAALFNIFNNFAIRHDNQTQKGDYGDEYLDWVFWTTLAAIHLLAELGKSKQ